jgi:hypothetical protein
MKRTRPPKPNKIPQVFRLRRDLVEMLSKHSAVTNINKTRLVELALAEYFAVKR